MARKKKLTKAIRLESNWDTFQIEHPEVKVTKDCKGKILSFSLPENYSYNEHVVHYTFFYS